MIVAIYRLVSDLVTAVTLEVILGDLIHEPRAQIGDIEVRRCMRSSDRVLVQRLWRQILPVLADPRADVIIAALHANALLRKQLCNSLAYRAGMTSLTTKDIRVSIHRIKLVVLDPVGSAYCSDMLGCIGDS